jgi:putative peptidoglycan lipid II flippase
MDRESQQPPLPSQPPVEPQIAQNPVGWQYDQEQPGAAPRRPAPPLVPPQNVPPLGPKQYPSGQLNVPARYSEPVADMGTTLGYGQGMEYQYFDIPQPSQPMPKLRMERLQQLRQERLRRDVQHARPDITTFVRRRKGPSSTPLNSIQSPPLSSSSKLAVPPLQSSKSISKPLIHSAPPVAPAAQPAQDTAMLKKVRIGRASAILMAAFIASRVLGLVRTSMFAATFGTANISDAFVQASLIPDTIFNIIAGGALSSAFIPTFTRFMVGENDERMAWQIANTALTLAVALMVVLAIIGAIFAYPLVWLYSPSYRNDPVTLNLMAMLVRIMLIQAIILGGGVIVTSVLNAQQNFQLPAVGTVLYNVGSILGLVPGLALYIIHHGHNINDETVGAYFAAVGVVLGAGLNIGIQLPGLIKVGMYYKPNFNWHLPGILQIGHQMIPRVFNASVFSLTTFIDRYLIGLLIVVAPLGIDGLTTQYYQATQLVMLPLGIFGMAMSTAAFPTLTEYVAQGRMNRVRDVILETLRSILFMSIPSSIGLIVLAEPIIQALLAHGSFTIANAQSTAIPLAFFAVGLAGLAAVEILTRSFYAMRDSRTPVIISILQFAWKVAIGLVLLNPFSMISAAWGMGALALSTSLANLAEAVVLFIILNQRVEGLFKADLLYFILRVLAASASMGIVVLVVRILLDTLTTHVGTSGLIGILSTLVKLFIELFVGVFIYLRTARFFKLEELGPIRRLLGRLRLSWML